MIDWWYNKPKVKPTIATEMLARSQYEYDRITKEDHTMSEYHELSQKLYGDSIFDGDRLSRADKTIREWLEEKTINLIEYSGQTNVREILCLTPPKPDRKAELAEKLSKVHSVSMSRCVYDDLAEEALKWMTEHKDKL